MSLMGNRWAMIAWKRKYIPCKGVYSDGNAFCVLPHVHTNPTSVVVDVDITWLVNFNRSYHTDKNLFGDSVNDSKWLCNNYWAGGISTWETQIYCGTGYVYHKTYPAPIAGDRFRIKAYRDGTLYGLDLYKNGTMIYSGTESSYTNMNLGRLGIFTQNNAGPGDGVSPIPNRVPKFISINAMKYYDGNAIIADLVPCKNPSSGLFGFFNLVDDSFVMNASNYGSILSEEDYLR